MTHPACNSYIIKKKKRMPHNTNSRNVLLLYESNVIPNN